MSEYTRILDKIVNDNNATLKGVYAKLTKNTHIQFICKCGNEYKKKLVQIINVSGAYCKKCTMNNRLEKTKQTNLQKYGVENPFQLEEFKNKSKEAMMEKYGVTAPLQSDKIKEKIKQTNLQKYGVENPSQLSEIKQKKMDTSIKNFGTSYPIQSSEFREKVKLSNIIKYGVDNPSKNQEIKQKIKETFEEKYGGHPMYDIQIKEKMRDMFKEKYGGHPMNNDTIKEKVNKIFQEKYGGHPLQNIEVREKINETFEEKYGGHPMQNQEVMQNLQEKLKKYKKYTLPSGDICNVQGYEPYALNILFKTYKEEHIKINRKDVPRIKYDYDGKTKYYFPDIFIETEKRIIEVKSTWTYQSNLNMNLAKAKATIDHGYIFEFWIFDSKGNITIKTL